MNESKQAPHIGWAGQVLREGEPYGGTPANMSVHLSVSQKRAQSLEVFRQLIKKGVTECKEIAAAMGVPNYSVSRMAKRAKKAGWLDTVKRKYVIVNAKK